MAEQAVVVGKEDERVVVELVAGQPVADSHTLRGKVRRKLVKVRVLVEIRNF